MATLEEAAERIQAMESSRGSSDSSHTESNSRDASEFNHAMADLQHASEHADDMKSSQSTPMPEDQDTAGSDATYDGNRILTGVHGAPKYRRQASQHRDVANVEDAMTHPSNTPEGEDGILAFHRAPSYHYPPPMLWIGPPHALPSPYLGWQASDDAFFQDYTEACLLFRPPIFHHGSNTHGQPLNLVHHAVRAMTAVRALGHPLTPALQKEAIELFSSFFDAYRAAARVAICDTAVVFYSCLLWLDMGGWVREGAHSSADIMGSITNRMLIVQADRLMDPRAEDGLYDVNVWPIEMEMLLGRRPGLSVSESAEAVLKEYLEGR